MTTNTISVSERGQKASAPAYSNLQTSNLNSERSPASLADLISSIQITEVWVALGGGALRHGRGRAFWRDGDGFNIALSETKQVWHDHRDNRGGGVLDLIQLVLDCGRYQAVQWLSEYAGIPLHKPGPQRVPDRRRERSELQAAAFVEWRDRRFLQLREKRNYHLGLYHSALQKLVTHGLNHPLANAWADGCEINERKYQRLDVEIANFQGLSTDEQVQLFRSRHGAVA